MVPVFNNALQYQTIIWQQLLARVLSSWKWSAGLREIRLQTLISNFWSIFFPMMLFKIIYLLKKSHFYKTMICIQTLFGGGDGRICPWKVILWITHPLNEAFHEQSRDESILTFVPQQQFGNLSLKHFLKLWHLNLWCHRTWSGMYCMVHGHHLN
jgi:hypothetical protein